MAIDLVISAKEATIANLERHLMATPKNERLTENIVRDELRELGYYRPKTKILVEEQKSQIEDVKRLMKAASKSGQGGGGSPEFIISCQANSDFLVIIECKANPKDHVSEACKKRLAGGIVEEDETDYAKRVQRFGVDGALHYAKRLAREFNVVAVAVSGESKDAANVSTFLFAKGAYFPKILKTKDGGAINALISWEDYFEHGTFDASVRRVRTDELMAFSRDLHNFMRDHAKLMESQKPLLVSGTLIALRNAAFIKSFDEYAPAELPDEWLGVIAKEIRKADIRQAKKEKMVQPYSTIAAHPALGKATTGYPKGILHEIINRLKEKVWPFLSVYRDFDVVGQFYGEFLRYTDEGNDGRGITLTPRHITELFALLANVNKSSRVLDICAGTAGFLIAAMYQMMTTAFTENERKRIREDGLVGVEPQPDMFALAASNMILRGDGKANLYQGSCFDAEIVSAVAEHRCNVGLLNPPYSQSDPAQHELRFIKQMLDCLCQGSPGLALIPINRAISPHPAKAELLKHHTLEAVMSMPQYLFHPKDIVTCIMVFTAKIPHAESNRKTWFGYWKDDGFIKTRHRGRAEDNNRWPAIRDRWVESFRNRQVIPGESVMRKVDASDEWCAEAYMEADYSTITRSVFECEIRKHILFALSQEDEENEDEEAQ